MKLIRFRALQSVKPGGMIDNQYYDAPAFAKDFKATVGTFFATKAKIIDIDRLRLRLTLKGKTMQDGATTNRNFKIPFLVSYRSQFMTLLPGDVISTGTPAGVGLGINPQVYLKEGEVMELGIENLVSSRQNVAVNAH